MAIVPVFYAFYWQWSVLPGYKNRNTKKSSKPNQPHHESKKKKKRGYKTTTNSKNSWRANCAHENLKRIPFSIEQFLHISGTRNNQAINGVPASFARKERCICSARTWEGMVLATILPITLSLFQYTSSQISVSEPFPATAQHVEQLSRIVTGAGSIRNTLLTQTGEEMA